MSEQNPSVPSLDTLGWITESDVKCDRILSHFLLAEYSQTALFPGHVASMPWLIQEHKDSMLNLVEKTKSTLEKLFGAYFNKAETQVTYRDEPNGTTSLFIFVEVTDTTGKVFSVAKALEIEGSRIKRIAMMNEDGTYTSEYELDNINKIH